jgi:hypothetical protein
MIDTYTPAQARIEAVRYKRWELARKVADHAVRESHQQRPWADGLYAIDTQISLLPAAGSVASTDEVPLNQSGTTRKAALSLVRNLIGEGLSNGSLTNVAGGYAADTYLAGSTITAPAAGAWQVGTILKWQFDLVKTAAGVAALVITVRLGTLGTTGDAAIYTFTFGAGTAAVDTGIFDITVEFRSIGAGTAAVVAGKAECRHHLAATGLVSTGASGIGILVPGASAGFASTTQTKAGLSVNGGASFAGTNTMVATSADKL